jgi:hypothetical protein
MSLRSGSRNTKEVKKFRRKGSQDVLGSLKTSITAFFEALMTLVVIKAAPLLITQNMVSLGHQFEHFL